MRVNASVSINSEIVQDFSIYELEKHFRSYEVVFRGLNFTIKELDRKLAVFSLNGSKDNLRAAIKGLYTLSLQPEGGIEDKPANSVPANIKNKLEMLQDDEKYEKLYNYCADEYMKHCALNDQIPHPEVNEDFVY